MHLTQNDIVFLALHATAYSCYTEATKLKEESKMKNQYMDHKSLVSIIEAVLFTMLGIFCLAYKAQSPAVFSAGSVAFTGRDLLGITYIMAGFFFGHWPIVHFVRPLSTFHEEKHKTIAA